jgi:hypothetical protein
VRRCAFDFAAAASLLLCVATAVLWVRSYSVFEGLSLTVVESVRGNRSDWKLFGFSCVWGRLTFTVIATRNFWSDDPPAEGWHRRHEATGSERWQNQTEGVPNTRWFGRSGRLTTYGDGMVQSAASFTHPLWLVSSACAIVPAVLIGRRRLRAGRASTGRWIECGYDLRATPDRCPECGTPTATPTPTTTPAPAERHRL